MTKKAIIIGGGIGGAVASLAIKKAGFDVEIYEARSESATSTGWFLNLAGNGIEILRTLDIDAKINQEGSPAPRMIISNAEGKPLGEVRNGARNGLTESVIIRRGTLQEALYEAVLAQDIPFHFGKKLCDIKHLDDQTVMASFEDGTRASGDLLVGADGIHSCVRQIINPNAPKPEYSGLVSTGGFTRPMEVLPTPKTQYFIFGKRAFFGYHVRASGEIYWFNNHAYEKEPDPAELASLTNEEWKQALLKMHADDLPLLKKIIRSTDAGIGAFPIYDIASQPTWYKGSIVLIGDAVHAISPSSGQGASLAMEDAVILAKCLRDIQSLDQAFAKYQTLRRDRVEAVVKWGRTFGGAKIMSNPIQVWFRDHMMPFFLKFAAKPEALDWVYGYEIDWDERVSDEEPRTSLRETLLNFLGHRSLAQNT
uniref:FAD-binding domain-containing protein n=1 Tax=Aplanochytrium stocchinoi TaxID=215587 RepID=A0A7S3LM35_9STRA|mmetsp:Transcript_15494/g.19898  ORF Transcript_15494/g.19898 Transcript_15494/m.19898 type:complete len:424 (-) Transcript_15494:35-1306(-)|eukprot:CAMPEP_0204870016 /NCGR_PEP_ID=MMETSP1348-20121228/31281_1 /ASSEMBLY_ACC=CAM_ASM_000700 /TAXON_ID=215587 /ORGANISM="Aplanochytrium stocchinoi, Strain GSBS06" /LENGTH=423 /DNA_ID=CAMNT_0052023609 /DNA_START=133 /DNA_END=1404 /DNA_ORIENTATION=-